MKKLVKRISLVLSCVMVMGLLAGCSKFDAAAYLQASLDNSYKNQSQGLVDLKVCTAEEAAAVYEEGLDTEFEAFLSSSGFTEEQCAGLRDVIADILAGAKYTVGEAEKQDDGSYVVTVSYEQMNVFEPAMTDWMEDVTAWTEEIMASGEVPSDDEMIEELIGMLETSLAEACAAATYDEPQTTTVRIEIVDKMYTPNEEDIYNLEYVMFDTEAMENMSY